MDPIRPMATRPLRDSLMLTYRHIVLSAFASPICRGPLSAAATVWLAMLWIERGFR